MVQRVGAVDRMGGRQSLAAHLAYGLARRPVANAGIKCLDRYLSLSTTYFGVCHEDFSVHPWCVCGRRLL
jgi:hypothetical protein